MSRIESEIRRLEDRAEEHRLRASLSPSIDACKRNTRLAEEYEKKIEKLKRELSSSAA
jgi:hypothetical protein